jgi:hypothetical protein
VEGFADIRPFGGQTGGAMTLWGITPLSCRNVVRGRVELRGFEPLTPCMPSQYKRRTGHHDTASGIAKPQMKTSTTAAVVMTRRGQ